jgi:hypothetical protein
MKSRLQISVVAISIVALTPFTVEALERAATPPVFDGSGGAEIKATKGSRSKTEPNSLSAPAPTREKADPNFRWDGFYGGGNIGGESSSQIP